MSNLTKPTVLHRVAPVALCNTLRTRIEELHTKQLFTPLLGYSHAGGSTADFDPSVRNPHHAQIGPEMLLVKRAIQPIVQEYVREFFPTHRGDVHPILNHYMWYGVGGGFPVHKDNWATHGTNPERLVTTLLYLGGDFVGGDISFPEHGLTIIPKFGDLLVFYSGLSHGVAPITAGNRFLICNFWSSRENN